MSETKGLPLPPPENSKIESDLTNHHQENFEESSGIYGEIHNLLEQSEKKASTDEMTGYRNRNAWIEYIKHFGSRNNDKTTLIVCDMNGLKETNDNEGHPAGDIKIKKTASFLMNTFRRSKDYIFYRTGGDELLVVAEGINDLDNFKKYVDNQFSLEKQKNNGVDFAYGIAHFNAEIDIDGLDIVNRKENVPYKTTFDRADSAMYEMKAQQKNP